MADCLHGFSYSMGKLLLLALILGGRRRIPVKVCQLQIQLIRGTRSPLNDIITSFMASFAFICHASCQQTFLRCMDKTYSFPAAQGPAFTSLVEGDRLMVVLQLRIIISHNAASAWPSDETCNLSVTSLCILLVLVAKTTIKEAACSVSDQQLYLTASILPAPCSACDEILDDNVSCCTTTM